MDLTKFKYIYELVQYLINHIDYFEGNFVLDEVENNLDQIEYDILTYSPYGKLKGIATVTEDSIYIEILNGMKSETEYVTEANGGYSVNIPYLIFTLDYKDDPYGYFPGIVKGSEEDVMVYNKFFTTQDNGSST